MTESHRPNVSKKKIVKNVKDNTTYEGKKMINPCDSHIKGKCPLVGLTVGSCYLSLCL